MGIEWFLKLKTIKLYKFFFILGPLDIVCNKLGLPKLLLYLIFHFLFSWVLHTGWPDGTIYPQNGNKMRSGVKFINVLLEPFLCKSLFGSFSLVTLVTCKQKKAARNTTYKKYSHKMLMKLTTGVIFSKYVSFLDTKRAIFQFEVKSSLSL